MYDRATREKTGSWYMNKTDIDEHRLIDHSRLIFDGDHWIPDTRKF